jgi:hypothetical protein
MTKLNAAMARSTWLAASAASANYLRPMPLAQQRAEADTILIARAGRNTDCPINAARMSCVELVDPVYLKGRAGRQATTRYLVTYSRVAEQQVNCCTPGATYLMFLRSRGDYLYPVIGHWSVLRAEPVAAPVE